jgi:hypothetical protein
LRPIFAIEQLNRICPQASIRIRIRLEPERIAKKAKSGEVNRFQTIRDLLKEKPRIKANDAVSALAAKGITINASLFYIVKGKVAGRKSRRKKVPKHAIEVTSVSGSPDAVATIRSIKKFAAGVGGLRRLKMLVDALSE